MQYVKNNDTADEANSMDASTDLFQDVTENIPTSSQVKGSDAILEEMKMQLTVNIIISSFYSQINMKVNWHFFFFINNYELIHLILSERYIFS